MTKPGTARPDTRRRRASTGQLMDGIMGLARRLPLTRQVLADQLETATPAQTGVHARVDERRDRIPGAFQTRATARTGRVPPNQDARRLRPGRPCASPSTTGGRHWNPSTSSSTRRTWSCSALPAPARPTWPSRWPGRPAWRAYRPGSSPPPSSSCDYCAPTRRTGSTGSSPRSAGPGSWSSTSSDTSRSTRKAAASCSRSPPTRTKDRASSTTANIEFSGWGRIFGDPNTARRLSIDRTVHHGRMTGFEGDSYRKTHALMQ